MWIPWAIEVGTDILLGFLLAMVLMGPAKPAMPADQQTTRVAMSGPPTFTDAGGTGEVKISSKITAGNRCMVPGVYVNGRGPFEMMADSGAPDPWFTVADLPKLGIKKSSLDFQPMKVRGWLRGSRSQRLGSAISSRATSMPRYRNAICRNPDFLACRY